MKKNMINTKSLCILVIIFYGCLHFAALISITWSKIFQKLWSSLESLLNHLRC